MKDEHRNVRERAQRRRKKMFDIGHRAVLALYGRNPEHKEVCDLLLWFARQAMDQHNRSVEDDLLSEIKAEDQDDEVRS